MQAAFVLHRWPYQEHSLIVELFTREHGRLRVVGRSARRAKAGSGALLQPFRRLNLDWRGRGELKTLTSVDADGTHLPLQGQSLYCGFYLNELLQRLLPEQAALPQLFDDYQRTLELLADNVITEPVLRRFEWQLLQHLELNFDWLTDVDSGLPVEDGKLYYLRPEEGFVPVLHGQEPLPHIDGRDLVVMARFDLNESRLLHQYKRIMRAALAPHLGARPLRSRELFTRRHVIQDAVSGDKVPLAGDEKSAGDKNNSE